MGGVFSTGKETGTTRTSPDAWGTMKTGSRSPFGGVGEHPRTRLRNTQAAPAVVQLMSTIIPALASFRSAVCGGSLLIFTLCIAACGDSPAGPGGGVVMGRVYAGNGFTCGIVEGGRGLAGASMMGGS